MMNRIAPCLAIVLTGSAAAALPPNVQKQQVLSGLNQPVTIEFIPADTRMLILQKQGQILITDPNVFPTTTSTYMTLLDIDTGGYERGLMDIAFDPNFATNGWFYLYYSNASTATFRLSRFVHDNDHAHLEDEVVIWEDNEPYSSHSHYGASVEVGPDGMLYIVTGDEFDGSQPMDLTRAGGKVIRIKRDGTIPAGNPFADGDGGNLDEIWARGLRNPFRASWDLPSGRYFIADVGGNDQATAWEDLHLMVEGVGGANFGWPDCEGACGNPAFEDPIFTYPHLGVSASITGGFVYRGSQFPAEYFGRYFFADYTRNWVHCLEFDATGLVVVAEHVFDDNVGGSVVDLKQAPDGSIYYLDWGGRAVWKYVHDNGNQPPTISATEVTNAGGAAPRTVSFSVTAEDPEGDTLEYRWFFGDGAEATGAGVDHLYTANGVYDAHVRVSDPTHLVLSPTIAVEIGNRPTATITSPMDGVTFRAGEEIALAGGGTDTDGPIPPLALTWTVRFLHNGHSHPGAGPFAGPSASFTVPTSGHDFSDDTGYEITLTVTDIDGLTDSKSVTIDPDKVNLTIGSTPSGVPFLIDGFPRTTPFVIDTLIDFEHTIRARDGVCSADRVLTFTGWSDGGAIEHTVVVPDQDTVITAQFTDTGTECDLPVLDGLVAWYRSDTDLFATAGVVSDWLDASPSALHLVGAGAPSLLTDALNGYPAIRLDGIDDRLEHVGGVAPLPAGNADRSMFHVVRYNGVGFGGITYGNPACNEVFGLSVANDGRLMLHGWCGENDFIAGEPGTGTGWMTHSVIYGNNLFVHRRDGNLIGSGSHPYATDPDRLVIGAEIDTTPHVALDVVEVLIYDRAIDELERVAVEAYLRDRYFPPVPPACDDTADCNGNGIADGCELAYRGTSMLFDGDDVVNILEYVLAGDFTIEAWASLAPGVDVGDGIIGRRSPGQDLNFHANRLRLRVDGADVITAVTPTPPGPWMHYALARSGERLSLYVNGVPDMTAIWSGVLELGVIGRTAAGMFGGEMDEVRIWGRARTAQQIADFMDRDVPANSPGLIGNWRFDAMSTDQRVHDFSGNGNHGTLGVSGEAGADDPTRVIGSTPVLSFADTNEDGSLDECDCPADRDGDRDGDISDLLDFLSSWFEGCAG